MTKTVDFTAVVNTLLAFHSLNLHLPLIVWAFHFPSSLLSYAYFILFSSIHVGVFTLLSLVYWCLPSFLSAPYHVHHPHWPYFFLFITRVLPSCVIKICIMVSLASMAHGNWLKVLSRLYGRGWELKFSISSSWYGLGYQFAETSTRIHSWTQSSPNIFQLYLFRASWFQFAAILFELSVHSFGRWVSLASFGISDLHSIIRLVHCFIHLLLYQTPCITALDPVFL